MVYFGVGCGRRLAGRCPPFPDRGEGWKIRAVASQADPNAVEVIMDMRQWIEQLGSPPLAGELEPCTHS
jgi:hypothetical protein